MTWTPTSYSSLVKFLTWPVLFCTFYFSSFFDFAWLKEWWGWVWWFECYIDSFFETLISSSLLSLKQMNDKLVVSQTTSKKRQTSGWMNGQIYKVFEWMNNIEAVGRWKRFSLLWNETGNGKGKVVEYSWDYIFRTTKWIFIHKKVDGCRRVLLSSTLRTALVEEYVECNLFLSWA